MREKILDCSLVMVAYTPYIPVVLSHSMPLLYCVNLVDLAIKSVLMPHPHPVRLFPDLDVQEGFIGGVADAMLLVQHP